MSKLKKPVKKISSEMPFASRYVEVKGSKMHYIDEGEGQPILLLHGNPTSSYLWRNIIPYLKPLGRVIAPDLIGMGKSEKPDIDYTFHEHASYLEAFIDAVRIKDKMTLVVHDWGSGLGFNYAANNPDKIRAVALMEAQAAPIVPTSFDKIPIEQVETFKAFRNPEQREFLLREQNVFIEQFLPQATFYKLSEEIHNTYRAPFKNPEDRSVLIMWPSQIPIDGEPKEVVDAADQWNEWLKKSDIPKLILYAEPGMFLNKKVAETMTSLFPNAKTAFIGEGLHFVQESQPDAIGDAIANWLMNQKSS